MAKPWRSLCFPSSYLILVLALVSNLPPRGVPGPHPEALSQEALCSLPQLQLQPPVAARDEGLQAQSRDQNATALTAEWRDAAVNTPDGNAVRAGEGRAGFEAPG